MITDNIQTAVNAGRCTGRCYKAFIAGIGATWKTVCDPGTGVQMDQDNLLLLEEQNLLRRSKIFTGSQRTKFALTEAIKNLLNVSGREADVKEVLRLLRIFYNLTET